MLLARLSRQYSAALLWVCYFGGRNVSESDGS